MQAYMKSEGQAKISIEKFGVLTSISHGKYAAVSSSAYMSNGDTALHTTCMNSLVLALRQNLKKFRYIQLVTRVNMVDFVCVLN